MAQFYNFSPGPAIIPQAVHDELHDDLKPVKHASGQTFRMPILEMGHRTPDFEEISHSSQTCIRELLNIPANYHVLFLAGGARAQYAMVPINLASHQSLADYFDTGYWSQCAMSEAQLFTKTHVVARVTGTPLALEDKSQWEYSSSPDYIQYIDNETLTGVEMPSDFIKDAASGSAPVVCDMTSNLLTRPVDVSQYGVIFAAAQKNIGIAGLTVVLVRDDLCKDEIRQAPSLYNYATLAKSNSCYNTPPIFPWYVASKVLEWTRAEGGVAEMDARSRQRSQAIYDVVDSSGIYFNDIDVRYRSRVNVSFRIESQELLELFLERAQNEGFHGLRGHKAIGGVRASLYNAMPLDGALALADFMREFERKL